jgi:hypothetical protein
VDGGGAEFKLTFLSVTPQHPVQVIFFEPLIKVCGFFARLSERRSVKIEFLKFGQLSDSGNLRFGAFGKGSTMIRF